MRKVYVAVSADFDLCGRVLPRFLTWEDGTRYEIARVKNIQRAAALRVGGVGLRYTVVIRGQETYLWLEAGKYLWFVEGKDL